MKKHYYNWDDMHSAAHSIVLQMNREIWNPDYIIGVVRDGLPLATMISHIMNVELWSINPDGGETNCWMSEDAFGFVYDQETFKSRWDINQRKKILIVDGINDSGATFNWIKTDWQSSCMPHEEHAWQAVWRDNVRFAVMTDNIGSEFETHYHWHSVDTTETQCVYPFEYDLQI